MQFMKNTGEAIAILISILQLGILTISVKERDSGNISTLCYNYGSANKSFQTGTVLHY